MVGAHHGVDMDEAEEHGAGSVRQLVGRWWCGGIAPVKVSWPASQRGWRCGLLGFGAVRRKGADAAAARKEKSGGRLRLL